MLDPTVEVFLSVPFHDLDPLQIVWHGHYLKYFDRARQELVAKAGLDLFDFMNRAGYVFPVIRSSVTHHHPLRYRDKFVARASLVECSVKIVLDFEVALAESGIVCARGRGEQCALKVPEMEMQLAIPPEVRRAFGSLM